MGNYVFVFGKNKKICRDVVDAIMFINSIKDLKVNSYCEKKLRELFSGKKIATVSTSGCGFNRVKIYEAMADTVEEHESLLKKKSEEEEYNSFQLKMNELYEKKEGLYSCSIYFSYESGVSLSTFFTSKDYTVKAESPYEAYKKGYELISKEFDNKICLCIGSAEEGFSYDFLN